MGALAPVVNALVLWNTRYLAAALDELCGSALQRGCRRLVLVLVGLGAWVLGTSVC